MGIKRTDGFTIIEVMLFLGITSLMIITMIVGTGASLSTQRYRDSVESFRSLIQDQYSSLSSIQNDRNNNWSCDGAAATTEGGSAVQPRGQSRCMIVGKYMRVESGDVSIYTVLAREIRSGTSNDIAAMANDYAFAVANTEVREERLEWGARIAWAAAGGVDVQTPRSPRNIGILFVRSPKTGLIYTFTSNSIPSKTSIGQPTFTDLIKSGTTVPGRAARMICIDSNGIGSMISGNLGVSIASYAVSPSSVKFHTNEDPDGLKC